MNAKGEKDMTEKHKKAIGAIAIVICIVFSVAVGYFIGIPMVSLAEDPAAFQTLVQDYDWGGKLIFVGMVVLQVLVAFIPGEPIELAAGYAFGFLEGTLLTLVGFLIGSWIVFVLVRKFGVKLVEVFFSQEQIQRFSFLKNPRKTKVIAFLLMLIPGTPKDFLSYFAGLTTLTLRQWLLIVAVGRLPSLVTSTATGAAAGQQNYVLTAITLAITALLTLAGILYYRRIVKQQQAN
jgi:uncharacterized membrane protein YdjX (TVP38/TMEM64 family)